MRKAASRRLKEDKIYPNDNHLPRVPDLGRSLRVSPGRVRIERELDSHDPISFIRLHVPGPVTRISLTWTPGD